MSLRLSQKKNKKSSRLLSKRRKIQLGVSPKKNKMLSRSKTTRSLILKAKSRLRKFKFRPSNKKKDNYKAKKK